MAVLQPLDDKILLVSYDGAVWRTEGTSETTTGPAAELPVDPYATDFGVVSNRLAVCIQQDSGTPVVTELWVSDGTAAGTQRVEGASGCGAMASVTADRLAFTGYPKLWMTDGTLAGTLTAAHGLLVFAAADGTHGLEAWRSDGTAAGTFLLKDVNPGFDASAPGPFTPIARGLVLSGADDGEHGRELWAYPVTEEP